MSKTQKKPNINNIDYELGRVEEKIKEFQDYLKENTIITKVVGNEIKEASELQTIRHREIEIQIKINDALLRWLPILKSLREEDQESKKKETETRGDVPLSGIYKRKLDE